MYAITELQKARERRLKKRRTGGQAKMRERRADELKENRESVIKYIGTILKTRLKRR